MKLLDKIFYYYVATCYVETEAACNGLNVDISKVVNNSDNNDVSKFYQTLSAKE